MTTSREYRARIEWADGGVTVRHAEDAERASNLLAFELKNPRGETPHRLAQVESRICREWEPVDRLAQDEEGEQGSRFGERLRALVARWVAEDREWQASGIGDRDRHQAFALGHLEDVLGSLAAEIDADAEREREHTDRWSEAHDDVSARADRSEADAKLLRMQIAARERDAADLRRRIEEAVANTVVPVTRRQVLAALAEIFGRDGSS